MFLKADFVHAYGEITSERKIRKQVIEADLIEGIIALPPNLFYNTSYKAKFKAKFIKKFYIFLPCKFINNITGNYKK